MFVLDVSVVGAWYFPDEHHALADKVLERFNNDGATAPALFWFELRNALLIGERRGRISETDTARILAHVNRLPLAIDRDPDEAVVFQLARTHKLSFYDAAYLELARRKNAVIATLDSALIKAANTEKVPLLGATK
jgi:predicted nucleic acid-binding protein